jgi:hypothetical protein
MILSSNTCQPLPYVLISTPFLYQKNPAAATVDGLTAATVSVVAGSLSLKT